MKNSILSWFSFIFGSVDGKDEEALEPAADICEDSVEKVAIGDPASNSKTTGPTGESSADSTNDEKYWWKQVEAQKQAEQTIALIDEDSICDGIKRRVEDNTFKLIEIPSNTMKAMDLIRKKNFSYQNLEKHLERSPAICSEIMRIANSSLFRRRTPVSRLSDAFPRLGQKTLLSILYISSTRTFVEGKGALVPLVEDIVNHSYAVATIATYLTKKYYRDPDEAFLAGLLHDIGKIAIISDLSENAKIKEFNEYANKYILDNVLDPLHEYIGRIVIDKWNINPDIVQAVGCHHNLRIDGKLAVDHELPAIVNLSDTIARMLGKGKAIGNINLFDLDSARILGIEETGEHIDYLNNILTLFDDAQ